jgi:rhodanese-related sulfurtransferase
MDSTQIIVIVAIILFFGIKRLGQVSAAKARELAAGGAIVIDVRTPGEFAQGHLKGAVNVPLDNLGNEIIKVVPDKNLPILVYCLSGTRSGFARHVLKGKLYSQVYNLGSVFRAKSILE